MRSRQTTFGTHRLRLAVTAPVMRPSTRLPFIKGLQQAVSRQKERGSTAEGVFQP